MMKNMLMILIFGLMLLQGFMDNIRGVLIPSIQAAFQVDYTSLAWIVLISILGYITATFSGGPLIDRLGQKKVIFIGFCGLGFGAFGIAYAWNYTLLLLCIYFMGYGTGSINIGASTIAPILFIKNQAIMMNLLHFFYGLGAAIGPRYAGIMLAANFLWRDVYHYSLLILTILGIYFLFCRFPKVEKQESQQKLSYRQIISDKNIILFALILGFYVAAEIGIANWLVTYLQQGKAVEPLKSASYLSAFFLVFTLGRFVGGFIAERLGYMYSIILYISMALGCLALGIFGGNYFIFMISASGFFFSIVYPTMMALLIKTFNQGINSIISFVITASSLINMMGNWLVGKINDFWGVRVGFYLIPFYMTILLALVILLSRNLSKLQDVKK